MSLLYRSLPEVSTDGRTLVGIALPWEKPSTVRDGAGPVYLEEFSRSSADETLRRNPEPRPVFNNHGHLRGKDPLGVVHFERSESGLLFRSFLSRTRDADEALELVKDGALTDVSVGFRGIRERKRATAAGVVTTRTEIALRELSLAPTGFGQVPGAKVLAVRAAAGASREQRHATLDRTDALLTAYDAAEARRMRGRFSR